MSIDDRLSELNIALPKPMQTANLPFDLARIDGTVMYLSGHVPTELDGTVAKPLGKVGDAVSPEQAYEAARKIGLG